MRKLLIPILLLCALSFACSDKERYKLRNPESVVWNPVTKTYLISNAGGNNILSLKDKYEFFVFNKKPLGSPKGMAIADNTLYVADRNLLVGFDLKTGKRTYRLPIPDAVFLNDVAASNDGMVYVSDTEKNCIFLVNTETGKVETYRNKNMLKPNGLFFFYDEGNPSLAYVSFRDQAPLEILNLRTKALKVIPGTYMSFADGIARDREGSWLVSSWADSTVWKFSPDFTQRSRLEEKYDSPADIFFNSLNNELAIPSFNGKTVTFVAKVDTTGAQPASSQQPAPASRK
jgi:sugar lactone lactonase YvrE